jgi:hypothetical protein
MTSKILPFAFCTLFFIVIGISFAQGTSPSHSCSVENSPQSRSAIEIVNGAAQPGMVDRQNELLQRLFVRLLARGIRFSSIASGNCIAAYGSPARASRTVASAPNVLAAAASPIIQTYAGTDFTFQSEGQPAVKTPLGNVADVTVDNAGNFYIAQGSQVYRVDINGNIHVVAGNGFLGFLDGGDARNAPIYDAESVVAGPDGSIYLGESFFIQKYRPVELSAPSPVPGSRVSAAMADPRRKRRLEATPSASCLTPQEISISVTHSIIGSGKSIRPE